jgi:hypothetical protein
MHEAERLNLLPDLKEQRSMQVIQPAHFEGSAAIERSFLLIFVGMNDSYRDPNVGTGLQTSLAKPAINGPYSNLVIASPEGAAICP